MTPRPDSPAALAALLSAHGHDPDLDLAADPPAAPYLLDDPLCAQVDTEMFFPDKGIPASDALAVCAACDPATRQQCLLWALSARERFGIWGGMTERARRRLVRAREAILAARTAASDDEGRAAA